MAFRAHKFLILMTFKLSIFFLVVCVLVVSYLITYCQIQVRKLYPKEFYGFSFSISVNGSFWGFSFCLCFCCCGLRERSDFILCMRIPVVPAPFTDKATLPRSMGLAPVLKINCPSMHGFTFGLSILLHSSVCLSLSQYHLVLLIASL